MEAKLWVSLDSASKTSGGQAQRLVKTGFTLLPGMKVEDSVWSDARPIQGVNFTTNTPDILSVYMGRDVAESEAHFRQLVGMYRGHGWTVTVAGESED